MAGSARYLRGVFIIFFWSNGVQGRHRDFFSSSGFNVMEFKT